ncbi:hypothetical protein GQ600_6959 [Phytophthora cactorum]|nr:hypothetical protein GQ600_6959 [Phytophthora cactorum]
MHCSMLLNKFTKFSYFCVTNGYPILVMSAITSFPSFWLHIRRTSRLPRKARIRKSCERPARTSIHAWTREEEGFGVRASKSAPISLDMITVLHAFLDTPVGVKGFREGSRVWFNAVSSFAFYSMCRINEVLTFKWKDMSLRQYYPSVVAPHEVIEYGRMHCSIARRLWQRSACIAYTTWPKTNLLSVHTCTCATGWTTLSRGRDISGVTMISCFLH